MHNEGDTLVRTRLVAKYPGDAASSGSPEFEEIVRYSLYNLAK